MAALNRVDLIGRLGADPEIRRLNDGSPVVNIRLAVSDSWRDKATGERKERTEWVSVVIFNEGIAKVAEAYLKKGSLVFLSGSLQTRKWEKDGVERYTTEVVLQKFRGELQMLDSKGERDEQPGMSAYASKKDRDDDRTSYGTGARELDEDSIPF